MIVFYDGICLESKFTPNALVTSYLFTTGLRNILKVFVMFSILIRLMKMAAYVTILPYFMMKGYINPQLTALW